MNTKLCILLISLSCISLLQAQNLPRELLVEDARQMAGIIESCHPDPYLYTGGKIGFHEIFYQMLNDIPDEGMNVNDFWWTLSGFLANIKDGHTYLYPLKQPDSHMPGGIPMRFTVTSDSLLIVNKVYREDHKEYLGQVVESINNHTVDELLRRISSLYPTENYFDRFRNLMVYLWYADYLERLMPEWSHGSPVVIAFADKGLPEISVSTDPGPDNMPSFSFESGVILPATQKCDFVFEILDGNIGYLRIDKQDEFREYAEILVDGLKDIQDPGVLSNYRQQYIFYARKWHERYFGVPGPDSLELIVQQLPSFTEFMEEVTAELKKHKINDLIIDLREDEGGISLMSDILIYFLYGKGKLGELHNDTYEITYLSPMAIKTATSLNPSEINKSRGEKQEIPLQAGDYDFYTKELWENRFNAYETQIADPDDFKNTATFYKEYTSGKNEAAYTPRNVYVLGGYKTFSAGFETLVRLKKCGATFVGVPSAQSGNCFGMGIQPVSGLKNTRINLQVSVRKIYMIPDDEESGIQLSPDIPLDYRTLKKYNCDRNSTVSLAIEAIKGKY